ncbi:hypothetical protein [Asticcacaulis solisilvae]|uniref:hypothetical protein n=1 Tax=Asticcacaulis solisilvae TaxID=1217274 RepID=UPI003FD878DA
MPAEASIAALASPHAIRFIANPFISAISPTFACVFKRVNTEDAPGHPYAENPVISMVYCEAFSVVCRLKWGIRPNICFEVKRFP